MAIRLQTNRKTYRVEHWDSETGKKVTVKPADFGMETPRTLAQAKELERRSFARFKGGKSVGDYAHRFCNRRYSEAGRPISEQTNRMNEQKLKPFVEQFGDRTITSISRLEAKDYAHSNTPSVKAVKAMFNAAVADEVVERNPFAGVRPQIDKSVTEITWPTAEEVERLLAAPYDLWEKEYADQFSAMIAFACATGCRPGEVVGAKWEHYDPVNRRYNVMEQWNLMLHRPSPPKWDSYGEVIVLDAGAIALEKLEPRGKYMFTTKRGQNFNKSSLWQYFDRVREKAGVPNVNFKGFRHFHASYLLNELGLPPLTVAQQLRHKDGGELVVSTYGHPDRDLHLDRIVAAYTGRKDSQAGGNISAF